MTEVDGPEVPDEESLAFEAYAVASIAQGAADALRHIMARIIALYEAAVFAPARLRDMIVNLLTSFRPVPLNGRADRVATEAKALGIAQAMRYAGVTVDGAALDWTPNDVPDLDRLLTEGLAAALDLAKSAALETKNDVMAVVGRVGATAAGLEGNSRRIANEGINSGTAEVARALGLRLIWVPERDACLHCLAHAGWVVEVGQAFPPVSFDPAARKVWTVLYPPLHPNCRCRVRTTDAEPGPPAVDLSAVDPGAALAREARRSVVYQWTEHASGAAARRAAQALLDQGAALPKTVQDRARRKLRRP